VFHDYALYKFTIDIDTDKTLVQFAHAGKLVNFC